MFAKKVYGVGIKGTGMCALAELLYAQGVRVSGSDTPEHFYTDDILRNLGIPFYESFEAAHVPLDADLVVHSAAYKSESNPELAQAERLGLRILKYTDALGEYSSFFYSAGISGVNGKTTTTALAGTVLRELNIPAQVLAGSAVANFAPENDGEAAAGGGAFDGTARSCVNLGNKYFIAETCEYRGHFLAFHPRIVVLTNIEHDHQDFFPTYQSILDMFVKYICRLPECGKLIYCADDKGALQALALADSYIKKMNIKSIPYGFNADGAYKITSYRHTSGANNWTLACFGAQEFTLHIPGRHNVLNAAAAVALAAELPEPPPNVHLIQSALKKFRGSKRRCEVIGEADGVLFIDDYGHHPAAVKTTLEGLKEFYPEKRIIVSFMAHTYTRTAALLSEFASCFAAADILYLHAIYPSARETYSGEVSGVTLFEETKKHHPNVHYIDKHEDAAEEIAAILRKGCVFVTMGAGDNWKLGRRLYNIKRGII
ncbi:MAG: UDP-N-acetylmuramate--L-alanine ligase [Spirochaetaceae bacterium]|jgi:UDP-N-acetylmuramate--alanine ligase|nr:UDP-N-acetylmuramate--L-alanine ligase [Spirochaetaceae bacterium]